MITPEQQMRWYSLLLEPPDGRAFPRRRVLDFELYFVACFEP